MKKQIKLCPECESKMIEYDVPSEIGFKIPFTNFEIILRNWNGKDYFCPDCVRDFENRKMEDAYDAGRADAYYEMNQ